MWCNLIDAGNTVRKEIKQTTDEDGIPRGDEDGDEISVLYDGEEIDINYSDYTKPIKTLLSGN